MQVVSLFSGAGGMDYGFHKAGHEIIYAIDNNQDACNTYENNIGIEAVCKNIKKINDFPKGDLLIACCPCQGFSLFGTRKYDDDRNYLYKEIIRCLEQTKPKYVMLENVKGLLSLYKKKFFNMIIDDLRNAGYNVSYDLLNAKDYGASQDRLRVFIVGVRKDLDVKYTFPKKTHGPNMLTYITLKQYLDGNIEFLYDDKKIDVIKKYTSLRQAIGHLKPPTNEEYWNSDEYSYFYMSRNRRRGWNEVSFTIQANGRHVPLHPSSPPMKKVDTDEWEFTDDIKKYRRLSIKECALIQTFPENYKFEGNLSSRYRQIGNAVPPAISYQLANIFLKIENNSNIEQEQNLIEVII